MCVKEKERERENGETSVRMTYLSLFSMGVVTFQIPRLRVNDGSCARVNAFLAPIDVLISILLQAQTRQPKCRSPWGRLIEQLRISENELCRLS